jgi:predicted CopG family antitoxin
MAVIKVSSEAYQRLVRLSQKANKSISEIASELILKGQVEDRGEFGGLLELAMGVMGICGALCVLRETTRGNRTVTDSNSR